jgi:hypothetical protein
MCAHAASQAGVVVPRSSSDGDDAVVALPLGEVAAVGGAGRLAAGAAGRVGAGLGAHAMRTAAIVTTGWPVTLTSVTIFNQRLAPGRIKSRRRG